MRQSLTINAFIQRLKRKPLTDCRKGHNKQYQVNVLLLITCLVKI